MANPEAAVVATADLRLFEPAAEGFVYGEIEKFDRFDFSGEEGYYS